MSELTQPIKRWVYLATVLGPIAVPIISYGLIVTGMFMFIFVFVRAYKNFVFAADPAIEILELGRRTVRRHSSSIVAAAAQHHHHHRLLAPRDSYTLLKDNNPRDADDDYQDS